jgi:hypothetical protein
MSPGKQNNDNNCSRFKEKNTILYVALQLDVKYVLPDRSKIYV